jgi:hypothetical protein
MSVATSDGVTVEGQISPGFEACAKRLPPTSLAAASDTWSCLSNPVLVAG